MAQATPQEAEKNFATCTDCHGTMRQKSLLGYLSSSYSAQSSESSHSPASDDVTSSGSSPRSTNRGTPLSRIIRPSEASEPHESLPSFLSREEKQDNNARTLSTSRYHVSDY